MNQQFRQEAENTHGEFTPLGTTWNEQSPEKKFNGEGGSTLSQDHPLKINDSVIDYGIFAQEGRDRSHRV